MVFLQLFVNGLQLGAIYALTAVGFSLIFGSTKYLPRRAPGSAFAISGYIYFGGSLQARRAMADRDARGRGRGGGVPGLFMERFTYRLIQRHEASFFTVRSSRRLACRSSSRT